MKQILIIMIGIALLSTASALYAGGCIEVDLSNLDTSEDISYMIIGNTSNTEGLNVTFNETTNNASVCTVINYKPDTFTIVFFNKEKEVIYKSSGGGGGSTRTIYVDNETYIEVPAYIDREVYIEADAIISDEKPLKGDEVVKPSWSWWYTYLAIFIILVIGVYLWIRSIGIKEEDDEKDV